jgi:hypothetical protein
MVLAPAVDAEDDAIVGKLGKCRGDPGKEKSWRDLGESRQLKVTAI